MEIKRLNELNFDDITDCFNEAFYDYIIPVTVTTEYLKRRFLGGRVNLNFSFGAFNDNKLVGFIIHGIDYINNIKTAFNIATGVIPEYRGTSIVQKIYDYAIPILKSEGICQCKLEVICNNERAIKSYKKVGFSITRQLHCFSGDLLSYKELDNCIKLQKVEEIHWDRYNNLFLYEQSWENSKDSLLISKDFYDLWELHNNDELIGYVFINGASGYIPQFGVDKNQIAKNLPILFTKIKELNKSIKINNIDAVETYLINSLLDLGLKITLSQYEMNMSI